MLGQFKGDKLGLFYKDHTLSGHINEQIVYATPLTEGFGLKLTQRINGKDFISEFKKTEMGLVGEVFRTVGSGKEVSSLKVELTSVKAKEGLIEGRVEDEPFTAQVRSQSMQGNHYVNPEFEITLNGRTYRFQLENGMACMGCATKIVYVIVGVLKATGAL